MGAACSRRDDVDEAEREVELGHFKLQRSIGKGAFGKVKVVEHKKTKQLYALKYINKAQCIQQRAVQNIIQERYLLEEIHHPFICNLRFAFQDDENMFMALDLMGGGDLRFHLDSLGRLPAATVRFIIAETACGLAYLHSKNIVHRDLKPDNILLDEKGHASITDFNIAVKFKPEKPLTAMAGSMAYMAPEVLNRDPYLNVVDWWSLGICAFELIFGQRPFRGKTDDGLKASILNDPLAFNFGEGVKEKEVIEENIKSTLKGLMTREVAKRLGSRELGGFKSIQDSEWFAGMDWVKLEAKELQPLFVPDPNKANFDATHDLEELLLEDNPLRIRPRKRSKDGKLEPRVPPPGEDPETTKMHQLMEDQFTIVDCTKPRKIINAEDVSPTAGTKELESVKPDTSAVDIDRKESVNRRNSLLTALNPKSRRSSNQQVKKDISADVRAALEGNDIMEGRNDGVVTTGMVEKETEQKAIKEEEEEEVKEVGSVVKTDEQ